MPEDLGVGRYSDEFTELSSPTMKILKTVRSVNADIVTHVDPVTVDGKECDRIHGIILDNLQMMDMTETIQDLRIVKNHDIESILFEVPVSVEFQQKEQFRIQCSRNLQQVYPDSKVTIEFKNQMIKG